MRLPFTRREALALGAIVLASAASTIAFVLTLVGFTVMPDEMAYVKQAVEIGRGQVLTPGEPWFNSWAQLTPLLLAPLFKLFATPTAFDLAHAMNAIVMASAAVPVYLLARRAFGWQPAALLVAATSVAIPWMGMAGTLMTEPVAYAAFCWAALAMVNAVGRPGVRSDAVALVALAVAFFARTQLILLGPALLGAVLVHELGRPGRPLSARARAAFRGHWLLWCVVVVACTGVLALDGLDEVLGAYIAPTQGGIFPAGTLAAARELLAHVVVGIGVVPLAFTLAWVIVTLGRRVGEDEHAVASVVACLLPVLTVAGGAFLVRFTSGVNDRYLFYVCPLLLTGMAAALLRARRGRLPALVAAGAATVAIVAASDLAREGPSLDSPTMAFRVVLPGPDVIALVAAVVIALVAALAAVVPARVLAAAVATAVLAFCVVETQYTLREVSKTQAGASEEFIEQRDWIDRALPGGARAAAVIAPLGDYTTTTGVWWDIVMWNKAVDRVHRLRGAPAFDQGYAPEIDVDARTGRVPYLDPYRYVVRGAQDARFGLRGSRTVAAHAGVTVIEAERPYRAEWLVDDVNSQNGALANAGTTRIRVFPPPGRNLGDVVVNMRALPAAGGRRQSFALRSGSFAARGTVAAGRPARVEVPLSGRSATIAVTTGSGPAQLRILSVLPAS